MFHIKQSIAATKKIGENIKHKLDSDLVFH